LIEWKRLAPAAAAPAFARGPYRDYGCYSEYGNSYAFRLRHRVPHGVYGGVYGYHAYVPSHYATYCNQLPKAC
jgi:hypothetical protein